MKWRWKVRRFGRRLVRPFTVRVYVFDHTRIRVRSFPPLFEFSFEKSLQERIDYAASVGGGTITLDAATYVLRQPINLPRRTHLKGTGSGTVFRR